MNINVKQPEGNVFVILGRFSHIRDELKKAGANTCDYDDLLEGYANLKYDEILDKVEEITKGLITFSGR